MVVHKWDSSVALPTANEVKSSSSTKSPQRRLKQQPASTTTPRRFSPGMSSSSTSAKRATHGHTPKDVDATLGTTSSSFFLSSSSIASSRWNCWVCESICLDPGWREMPASLLTGGGARLSRLTLCRRCSAALSFAPGTRLLDIIHACNGTFASRSRSHTFIAFLREYKILLELIAMEYADAHEASTSNLLLQQTTPDMPDMRSDAVVQQLLECVEHTLSEDQHLQASSHQNRATQSTTPTRGALQRVGTAEQGREWLLRPTERELLEKEAELHHRALLIHEKRQTLLNVDKERQRGGAGGGQHSNAMNPLRNRHHAVSSAIVVPPSYHHHVDASRRTSPPREDHGEQQSLSRHVPSNKQHVSSNTPSMIAATAGTSPSRQRQPPRRTFGAALQDFFTRGSDDAIAELSLDIFHDASLQETTMSDEHFGLGLDPNDHTTGVATSQPRHHQDHNERGASTTTTSAPVTLVEGNATTTISAGSLAKVEHELDKLRTHHDHQRRDWAVERDALLQDRNQLRVAIDLLNNSTQVELRTVQTQLRQAQETHGALHRSAQLARQLSARFGEWAIRVSSMTEALQCAKTDLLLVESVAVVRESMIEAARLRREADARKAEADQTAEYLRAVADARREILRTQEQQDGRAGEVTSTTMTPAAASALRRDVKVVLPEQAKSTSTRGSISFF